VLPASLGCSCWDSKRVINSSIIEQFDPRGSRLVQCVSEMGGLGLFEGRLVILYKAVMYPSTYGICEHNTWVDIGALGERVLVRQQQPAVKHQKENQPLNLPARRESGLWTLEVQTSFESPTQALRRLRETTPWFLGERLRTAHTLVHQETTWRWFSHLVSRDLTVFGGILFQANIPARARPALCGQGPCACKDPDASHCRGR
jgi:hypothetical protein